MNFLQCYQMLDLEPGCNWAELQAAYRRLVQKWHPDRYESHPDQHHLAAQRILELNEAFEMLSRHYSVYGHLPGEPVPAQRPSAAATTAETKRYRAHRTATPVPTTQTTGKTPRWLMAIALMVLGYAMYLAFTDKPREEQSAPEIAALDLEPEQEQSIETLDGEIPAAADTEPTPMPSPAPLAQTPTDTALNSTPPVAAFFTRGDIPGKVLEAQGIPTRTVGDIWFYGDSEVHFNKGVVVSWHESPGHPLKAAGAIPGKPASAAVR